MNQFVRFAFIIFSFVLAVFSLVFLMMMINGDILSGMILLITRLTEQNSYRIIAIVFWLTVLSLCVLAMVYAMAQACGCIRRLCICPLPAAVSADGSWALPASYWAHPRLPGPQ